MKVSIVSATPTPTRARMFIKMLREEGIHVNTSNRSGKWGYHKIFLDLLKQKPHIVHILNGPDLLNPLTVIAAKLIGAKIIYDMRSAQSLIIKEKFKNPLVNILSSLFEWFGTGLSDEVITPNKWRKKDDEKRIRRQIKFIPQSVDTKRFKPKKKTSKKKIVLFAGHLVKKEGVGTLINAMRFLPNDVELWIAGSGREEAKLKQLAGEDSRIKFLGKIAHEKMPPLITKASVCTAPLEKTSATKYCTYTSVLKIGEFMAMKKPIVVSNIGKMHEAQKYGVVLAEPHDAQQFAKKIKEQLKKPIQTKLPKEINYVQVKKSYLHLVTELAIK